MNSILTAMINGAILSAPLTALIWCALRITPARVLGATARYVIWWAALAVTLALPVAYLPAHSSAAEVRIAPAAPVATPEIVVVKSAVIRVVPIPVAPPRPPRFPLKIAVGPWMAWIAAVWALTSAQCLLRLAVSCLLLRRRKARANTLSSLYAGRRIRIAASAEVSTPVAVGFLRPAILIPRQFLDRLDRAELDFIVLHEAAHLARRDDYALIVERLIEALFALHPIVRWIARQIDLEREIACDDRVVETTRRPHPYAACLTRVAELSGGIRPSFTAAAAARDGSHLTTRVEMLLDKTRRTGSRWRKTRLACSLAIVCGLASVAARTPALFAFTTPGVVTMTPRITPQVATVETPAVAKPAPRLIAQAPNPPPSPEPASPIVLFDISVRGSQGGLISGLKQEDFRITEMYSPEDRLDRRISYFREYPDSPVSIGVVSQNPNGLTLPMQAWLARLQQGVPVKIEFVETGDPKAGIRAAAAAAVTRIKPQPTSHKAVLVLDSPLMLDGQMHVDSPDPVFSSVDDGVTVIAVAPGPGDTVQTVVSMIEDAHYVVGFSSDGKYEMVRVGLSEGSGGPGARVGFEFRLRDFPDELPPCKREAASLPPHTSCH